MILQILLHGLESLFRGIKKDIQYKKLRGEAKRRAVGFVSSGREVLQAFTAGLERQHRGSGELWAGNAALHFGHSD